MKILVIQNRMGIGDMVIYLPFIEAISKKYQSSVSLLVKESSKASSFLVKNKFIDQIILLERNNKKSGRHDGLLGSFRLSKQLKKYRFEKVFIFNSSLRYNLICKLAGIKNIHQYELFKKKNQPIILSAKNLIEKECGINVKSYPKINLESKLIDNAKQKFLIEDNKINVILGIGGSGPTKRTPSKIILKFMDSVLKEFDCRFYLATGKKYEEQIILKEILSKFKDSCFSLDSMDIKDILPVIKNCNISICNDTSFSHFSAALDIPTIVLMCDTPLEYGNYSPNMHPIIPDNETIVTHGTNGKEKINPEKIFKQFKSIIVN